MKNIENREKLKNSNTLSSHAKEVSSRHFYSSSFFLKKNGGDGVSSISFPFSVSKVVSFHFS